MDRNDIIRMAREVWGDDSGKPWHESAVTHLEAFAALVAAAEREACAKIGEFYVGACNIQNAPDIEMVVKDYMRLIRARGQG